MKTVTCGWMLLRAEKMAAEVHVVVVVVAGAEETSKIEVAAVVVEAGMTLEEALVVVAVAQEALMTEALVEEVDSVVTGTRVAIEVAGQEVTMTAEETTGGSKEVVVAAGTTAAGWAAHGETVMRANSSPS